MSTPITDLVDIDDILDHLDKALGEPVAGTEECPDESLVPRDNQNSSHPPSTGRNVNPSQITSSNSTGLQNPPPAQNEQTSQPQQTSSQSQTSGQDLLENVFFETVGETLPDDEPSQPPVSAQYVETPMEQQQAGRRSYGVNSENIRANTTGFRNQHNRYQPPAPVQPSQIPIVHQPAVRESYPNHVDPQNINANVSSYQLPTEGNPIPFNDYGDGLTLSERQDLENVPEIEVNFYPQQISAFNNPNLSIFQYCVAPNLIKNQMVDDTQWKSIVPVFYKMLLHRVAGIISLGDGPMDWEIVLVGPANDLDIYKNLKNLFCEAFADAPNSNRTCDGNGCFECVNAFKKQMYKVFGNGIFKDSNDKSIKQVYTINFDKNGNEVNLFKKAYYFKVKPTPNYQGNFNFNNLQTSLQELSDNCGTNFRKGYEATKDRKDPANSKKTSQNSVVRPDYRPQPNGVYSQEQQTPYQYPWAQQQQQPQMYQNQSINGNSVDQEAFNQLGLKCHKFQEKAEFYKNQAEKWKKEAETFKRKYTEISRLYEERSEQLGDEPIAKQRKEDQSTDDGRSGDTEPPNTEVLYRHAHFC